jgi:iron complex transport system substrate-binding protein
MKRWALVGLVALAACAQTPDAPRHGLRLVSLNPCSDAVLAEVADPAQIAALSHYSRDPAASSMDLGLARRLPSATGSVEELAALRPELVIADPYLPVATAAALADLGIPVARLPIATSVAESREQVRELARLAGQQARGEALVARIDTALDRAAPPAGLPPLSAVVWQGGGIVPGDGSLIADILRRTGFRSLSAARGMRQADFLPLEVMLADPPQVILAAGNPRAEENRLLGHPALAALGSTRRVTLEPSLLWCGGPTIVRAAERLAQVRKAAS